MERFVLQWHITHCCNLRCAHCYQAEYQSHTEKAGLYAILDQFTQSITGRNFQGQINLTGGEPLLHPEFLPLAQEIRRRGFRLGILTNGTLIDEAWAKKLAALRPVFVQISLDGTESTHDAIRGKGNFRKALRGIDLLKRQGVRVLVSFTAQKSNYRQLPALARVCHRHRVDKLWWDRVVTETEADQASLALTTEQFRRLVTTSGRLQRLYRRKDGSSLVTNGRALQFFGCGSDAAGYQCSAGKNLLAITADGAVMPCRRLPFVAGNIFETNLAQIMAESRVLRQVQDQLFPEGCAGCEKLGLCGGGAKCVTYAQTGQLGLPDVNCLRKRGNMALPGKKNRIFDKKVAEK